MPLVNSDNMETCKVQESIKKPLTALQTGEQRNMKSQRSMQCHKKER